MNKEEKKEFKRIKNKVKQTWLDNDDIKFLVNSIEKLQKENEELLEVKVSASAHNRILELEKENEELKARLYELSRNNFPIIY